MPTKSLLLMCLLLAACSGFNYRRAAHAAGGGHGRQCTSKQVGDVVRTSCRDY